MEGESCFVNFNFLASTPHQHPHFDAHVLHRDTSVVDISITPEGEGLLIDWDLCVRLDLMVPEPPVIGR
jgi:hypothetical protein